MSNGPALILFVLYYCFLILIGNNKQILVFSLIVIANLTFLFIAEFNYHEKFPNYSAEKERIIDVYIVVFIALAIAFSFIYYAKHNYQKQYFLAKKADELKSSFLANMSHEIRTPLNAIVGFSSLLANRNYDDEKRDKYRSYISSNSEYLLHLVNDILDISKIESNQMELVTEEFKVENLFEQLREEYSRMLIKNEKLNVDVLYELERKDLYIRTDKYRFEQIIRNFLSNAIKFTKDGYIKFGSYKEKEKYVFYVKDTGVGMSEEDLNKIFSRFTKLNNNNEDILHRGVGLGLFLSKQLATLLGGDIWAESNIGKGSTFYLSLPLSISSR
jgi:signal transduction histidine kinase